MTAVGIRRFQPSDSLSEHNLMLQRAFAPTAHQGLSFTGAIPSSGLTLHQRKLADCFVAIADGRIVGSITLQATDRKSPSPWFRELGVARIHDFAVDPGYQCNGVGRALLKTAENWATCRQCLELALDTPQAAERFNAYCIRRGFRRIDTVRLSDNAHSSLVLSKALDRRALSLGTDHWPARHPAELAELARGRQVANR